MIIELVGVPASGKSTLRDQIVELLTEIGVEIVNTDRAFPLQRFLRKARTIVVHWRVLLITLAALLRDSRTLAIRIRSFRWVLATLDQYSSWQRSRAGVLVLDEGVLQRSVLLFFHPSRAPKQALLNSYLRTIPYPSLVIRLVLAPGEAALRYTSRLSDVRQNPRPGERFGELSDSLEDVITDIEDFITVVLSRAREIAELPLVQIPSDGAAATEALRNEVIPLVVQGLDRGPDLAGG